jgi:hypothetical protein
MTKLSPVTQTIMNAWIENTNYAPIDNEPFALAAALRAAADQLINVKWSVEMWELHQEFHSIATELESSE